MYAGHFDDPTPAYSPPEEHDTRPSSGLWPLGLTSTAKGKRRAPAPAARHFSSRSIDSLATSNAGDVEKTVFTYTLSAGNAELHFVISVEPAPDHAPQQYILFLSMKTGCVERPLCQPVPMKLAMNPRDLRFAVFVFPPRPCLPQGCLWSLRVWLRSNEIDHRIWAEDRLWVGRDPDFFSIENAMFARLRSTTQEAQVYRTVIGRALVELIVRWKPVTNSVWSLSLEYDANGVGRVLFSDFMIRLESCSPQNCQFMIYTIPIHSTPRGASHRLRVWIRAPMATPYPQSTYTPSTAAVNNTICHRIWATDNFKIGHVLDFSQLGSRMVMGVPSAQGPKVQTSISEQSMYGGKRRYADGLDGTDSVGSPPDSMNERKEVW